MGFSAYFDFLLWSDLRRNLPICFHRLHGEPPFVANTEEELHDLIKKAEVDYSMSHWDSVSMTGNNIVVVGRSKLETE